MVAVLGGLAAVLGAVLSPLGLVVAAIAGATAAFLLFTETGRRAVEFLKAGFASLLENVRATLAGIADALAAGDLALAARVGLAGVSLEWAKAVAFWTEQWVRFKEMVVDGWHALGDVIADAIAGWAAAWVWLTEGKAEAQRFLADLDKNMADERKRRDEGNRQFRQEQVEQAKRTVERAEADRDKQIREAAEAADRKRFEEEMAKRRIQFDAVKGSFAVPFATRQFGYGDSISKEAQIQLRIANVAEKNLPEMNQGIKDLGKQLQFK